jgi:hypothetical protein
MAMGTTYDTLNRRLSLSGAYRPVFVDHLVKPRLPCMRTFSGTPGAQTTKKPNQKTSETA